MSDIYVNQSVCAPDAICDARADLSRCELQWSRRAGNDDGALEPQAEYVRELNEAYHHFFFHYDATPLLVVETSQFDSDASEEALDDLVRQIDQMTAGTRYYVPRTK